MYKEDKNQTINYIKDLVPQAKNLHMKVMVLTVSNSYKTKDGNEVRSCKVADKTGSINLSMWGEYGNHVQPSDILSLNRCYAVLFKNCLTLYVGKLGSLVKVGEFCMVVSELPDLSEPNHEWIQQNQENKNASNQVAGGQNQMQQKNTKNNFRNQKQ